MTAITTEAATPSHPETAGGPSAPARLAESTGRQCPLCNSELLRRGGAHGRFLACSGYPECRFSADSEEALDAPPQQRCPDCGALMHRRTGRTGPFFSCIRYPDCMGARHAVVDGDTVRPARDPQPSDIVCPMCAQPMLEHDGRNGPYLRCTTERCGKTIDVAGLLAAKGATCPGCNKPMVRRRGRNGDFLSCSRYPECTATREIDDASEDANSI